MEGRWIVKSRDETWDCISRPSQSPCNDRPLQYGNEWPLGSNWANQHARRIQRPLSTLQVCSNKSQSTTHFVFTHVHFVLCIRCAQAKKKSAVSKPFTFNGEISSAKTESPHITQVWDLWLENFHVLFILNRSWGTMWGFTLNKIQINQRNQHNLDKRSSKLKCRFNLKLFWIQLNVLN